MPGISSLGGSVDVNGASLRYRIEGSGHPTLVVGSSIYYPRTFAQQLRTSLQLPFADVRHFAKVDAPYPLNKITLDTHAEDIERVRTTISYENMILIEHSHHGNIALEYAKRYPTSVSHLVLIGSPPCNVQRTIDAGNDDWTNHASAARKYALEERWRGLSQASLTAMPLDIAFVTEYVADGPKYWCDYNYDAS